MTDLNKLVTYMHNCLQLYNNRKHAQQIVINQDHDHMEWRQALIQELSKIEEQPLSQVNSDNTETAERTPLNRPSF